MFVAYSALSAMTSLLLLMSAVAKLRLDRRVVQVLDTVRVPRNWYPWLAACELAGALGLLSGIIWPVLGVAASVGLVLYFLGAMTAHVRVGDFRGLTAAGALLGLAVGCFVLAFLHYEQSSSAL